MCVDAQPHEITKGPEIRAGARVSNAAAGRGDVQHRLVGEGTARDADEMAVIGLGDAGERGRHVDGRHLVCEPVQDVQAHPRFVHELVALDSRLERSSGAAHRIVLRDRLVDPLDRIVQLGIGDSTVAVAVDLGQRVEVEQVEREGRPDVAPAHHNHGCALGERMGPRGPGRASDEQECEEPEPEVDPRRTADGLAPRSRRRLCAFDS